MWNFFRERKKRKLLRNLTRAFGVMRSFAIAGLIYWREKDRVLLIEESLAIVNMAEGREIFRNFLNAAALYINYKLLQDAYGKVMQQKEAEAVRQALKEYGATGDADINRIRQKVRDDLEMIDASKIKPVTEFDILIIRQHTKNHDRATEEGGELLAVGHYDGKTVEMASFDDIKHNLVNNREANDKENDKDND